MKNLFGALFFILLGLSACKKPAEPTKVDATNGYQYFGAEINDDGAISYDALLAQMGTQDSIVAKVTGTVENVCQVKGCWMNIISEKEGAESMFVKFVDYGFFMPLDCSGKKVVMNGTAYREVTSVDELRHYAEDEGKSPEEIAKITEPIEELKFMADGVILLPSE